MNEKSDYEKLKEIIKVVLDAQNHPNFDFINDVLSCKDLLEDVKLWYWFGELFIVRPEDESKKAGQMLKLKDWDINEDGTFCLIPKERKEGDEE